MSKSPTSSNEFLVCRNAKASHRYTFEETLEAGMVLMGSEAKSLRERRADLESAYASIDGNEVYVHNMHVAPYAHANAFGHEPKRTRKLLLHRRQIEKIRGRLTAKGYTLIPLRVYFKNGRAKIEIALAKGKRVGDKREEIKKKVDLREAKAAMAGRKG